ncbi:nicotinamide riboside transporter PnuC [Fodinicola feengrottensis]|uniref:Nicotinamide riboside transporter PnuC n=1 Tax=Fodinicola feengrottensis TaxID=435914 RepID=A0ABP4RMR9_9ACTN|nr:nicotinamide riboside transporter PnuC [Fodinicola feengrottensis]
MIDWLNHVLFVLGDDQVSVAELLGFVTGGACVVLTVVAHVANFPVGIANSAFFLVLFVSAQFYADAGLQVVYIVLGFIGWWQWVRGGPQRSALEAGRASPLTLAGCLVFVLVGTASLTVLLTAVHDAAPFWDALTTAISLAAQYLLNAKKIQNWFFWIAADIIYVPFYLAKQLELTAIVYVLFLGLCVLGLRQWRRSLATA